MTCSKCKREFYEGQKVTAQVLSIYHDLKPPIDAYRYCIEKPLAYTGMAHLVCGEE
jgi:hypothetical protein